MRDPLQRLSGKCARKGCAQKLGPLALKDGDAFCSQACCMAYHGVVFVTAADGLGPKDAASAFPAHSYTTSVCAVCGTPWKKAGGCVQCAPTKRRRAA